MRLPPISVIASSLLLTACFPQRPPVARTPIPMPQEVRALWVVRDVLIHADSIKAMVARAHDAGFNTLIVQVRGRGDAYYNSRWEPRADSIVDQPGFDPLALVLKEAHARNIAVHAWLNTALLANLDPPPSDTTHMFHRRPDLLAVPYSVARELYPVDPRSPLYRARIIEAATLERNQVEGVYLSAAAPETKEHIYSMWMDVLEHYDVEGLNFDYVRYPAPSHDYSRVSLDRFRRWLLPQLSDAERARFSTLEGDPLVYADSFPSRYSDFRRAQVTELVERIYFGVKKRNPNVIVSADVMANAKDAYENRFQDWTDWLRRGFLDVAALMAYNTSTDVVREQVRVAVEAGGGAKVWAGLGAYRQGADSVIAKITAARALGARGIVLFSYGSTVRPGQFNPNGDYLQRIQRAAWPKAP
ncbi:MAG: glycoside hydrolase family 10 protein [Gemmatimonadaceae bacterium]